MEKMKATYLKKDKRIPYDRALDGDLVKAIITLWVESGNKYVYLDSGYDFFINETYKKYDAPTHFFREKTQEEQKANDLGGIRLENITKHFDIRDYMHRRIVVKYADGAHAIKGINKDFVSEFYGVNSLIYELWLVTMSFDFWMHYCVKVTHYPVPAELERRNYKYVINVSDEYTDSSHTVALQEGIKYLWFPMNEKYGEIGLNSLYGALQIMYLAEQIGGNVLVHCKAGANRSQLVADAYYFMRTGKRREPCGDLIERRKTNGWLGLSPDYDDNAFEMNCNTGKLPDMEAMKTFLKMSEEVFQRDEADKNGLLDSIKYSSGITALYKKPKGQKEKA